MPRHHRPYHPFTLTHVIVRFTAGEAFLSREGARREYLRRLVDVLRRSGWRLVAYALMGNHVHLVLVSGPEPFETWARPLHTGFAWWVNRSGRRRGQGLGAVIANRPKTLSRPDVRAPYLIAYVHNNPPKAGVCRAAGDSTWTSHRAYLGLEEPLEVLDVKRGLELCGYGEGAADRALFDEHVRARVVDPVDPVLEGEAEPIPASLREDLPVVVPTSCDLPGEEIARVTAELREVDVKQLYRARTGDAVAARQVLGVVWKQLGRGVRELRELTGLGESAVRRAMAVNDDAAREDADRVLCRLFAEAA